ncbi:HutD family protein [Marinisporobacter balticus]|uniref:HutD protein n=1 Tax=Marinisporobacter balticus TaxID=2018667 RepID=A0A4R2LDJ6_9FIRM|nr:HutD family protein [Marinisporobacter balticus]TCO77425.1 HutD protein [Marinisporobacter balticus]
MFYSIEIIRKNEQKTSTWSGGTTTQLSIYPKDAVYSERNFKWRISSAKVEMDESVFTPLPDIWRFIMILDGEIHLEHEGHHSISLKPFEQDSFSGTWITKSFGKVKDFNLMITERCNGKIQAISLTKEESMEIMDMHDLYTNDFFVSTESFYCVDHPVHIMIDQKEAVVLQTGDLLLIHIKNHSKRLPLCIFNKGNNSTHVIRTSIVY